VIASSDKDLMQLVDDEHVMLWGAMRDRVYGEPEVVAKSASPRGSSAISWRWWATPRTTSPASPAWGEDGGRAARPVRHARRDLRPPRRGEEGQIASRSSRTRPTPRLARARDAAHGQRRHLRPRGAPLRSPDVDRLRALFGELGFTRFLQGAPRARVQAAKLSEAYETWLTRGDLERFAADVRARGRLALAVLGSSPEPMRAHLVGSPSPPGPAAPATAARHRYLGVPRSSGSPTCASARPAPRRPRRRQGRPHLKYSEVALTATACRSPARHGHHAGQLPARPRGAEHAGGRAERDAGVRLAPLDAAPRKRGPARLFDELEVAEAAAHAARFAEVTMLLDARFAPRLRADKLEGLLGELELPLSHVLAGMERTGVLIDPGALDALGKEMAKELATSRPGPRSRRARLQPGLPKQLEPSSSTRSPQATKKTKTGRSTDAEVLEALSDEHPLPGLILEHAPSPSSRHLRRRPPAPGPPETGRIHTRWSQAVAATGRISSRTQPPEHPIRTALGKLIRRAFVAPLGTAS